jgi:uncharacterized membrane protein
MTIESNDEQPAVRSAHVGRYILIGFLTVAPLWVTWLVFDFLLNLLARVGDSVIARNGTCSPSIFRYHGQLVIGFQFSACSGGATD